MSRRNGHRYCWRTRDMLLLVLFHACCFQLKTGHCALRANAGDIHPWWRVDLGAEYCIGEINVITRQGCCGQHRFTAAVARAGLSSNYARNQPCSSPVPRAQATDGATITFPCAPARMARYVTLDIDSSRQEVTYALLQLAEVMVREHVNDLTTAQPFGKSLSRMTNTFFKLHKGALIANSLPLATNVAVSLTRCARYCSKDVRCFSFDFAPGDGQCRIHSLNTFDIAMTPSENFSVWVRSDEVVQNI
ncbi:uncharacterized protein LOC110989785 isoform X2 [Acanthaster planci]|uniref:Uncharacterized protein LOC110989785 isoform X2 n=1 Tax=Acanthaster planci TaxID=133434 RepID=A0A8B7ZYD3_ACAPL|nr:uncharacterized protein LOC110989785 isoform X2 [Acanthaster planci]